MVEENIIEWLGKLPSHWDTSRINGVYELRVQKVSDNDYPPLSVTKQGILPQLETVAKTNAHDDRKLVRKGDFAINSRSDRRGSCGISDYDGSVSLINTVMKPREEMCPKYYNWLFHTTQFADEFYKWGHGIVDDLWTTNWQDMKKITIPLPPLKEQNKIADFLDEKCAEIDSISAEIQEQIDTLEEYKKSVITEAVTKGLNPNAEMKDSGIEWIGQIPKGFEIKRIKHIGIYRNGLTYSPTETVDEKDGTLILRSSNVQNGKIVLDDNVYVSSSIPKRLMVQKGDILICSRNGSRELIGKNAIIENDMIASFGAFMMIYRCVSPKYMYYILNSNIFSYYLGSFFTSTINQLTGSNFGNMKIVYCNDISSQNEIVDYLDSKCLEIDGAIEDKQKQLELLDEYKKTLIYEYVTGKKEVA